MLCHACFHMLRGQDRRQWKGTYDLHFNHHDSVQDLRISATEQCGICRGIWDELKSKLSPEEPNNDEKLSITSSICTTSGKETARSWRLDFKINYAAAIRCQRTYVLKKTTPDDPSFGTPKSDTTASDEVFDLTMQWMKRCTCAEHPPGWYPTRLLDLKNLKRNPLDPKKPTPALQRQASNMDETTVSVVHPKHWEGRKPGHGNTRYVTLSHCWGAPEHHGPKLTSKKMAEFEAGVKIGSLPKTFRDAIRFAARLPQVGFIWIDSLCIKQGSEELEDWLTESALMDQVYSESFLNISATAASDSNGGLYFPRSPELLLEDEVSLNIDGIPVPWDQAVEPAIAARPKPKHPTPKFRWTGKFLGCYFQNIIRNLPLLSRLLSFILSFLRFSSEKTQKVTTRRDQNRTVDKLTRKRSTGPRNLRRCVILDTSFWTNRVDRAPVNTRAWVLQERLLCPRVLHFCGDQVAWECAEFDAAEARPRGIPNYQLTPEGLLQESQFKGLNPGVTGKALRSGRLKGLPDPVAHLGPQIHAFELWKRVVEVYSRTSLTDAGDKLIALSGIARLMSSRIGSEKAPADYVAGLWRPHLESQLLWKVEPVFNPWDNTFGHHGRRPKAYRAPTFTWAAVDVAQGNGITYGEVTDKEIYISIEDVSVKLKSPDSFGMVAASRLTIWGKLRRVKLTKKDEIGRFCWTVRDREELAQEEHTNVYLDSVQDTPFGTDNVYCLPTAKGGYLGTGDSTYIFCLLLRLTNAKDSVFERIGFTKLSLWADKKTYRRILDVEHRDVDLPHTGYANGKHRFVLE